MSETLNGFRSCFSRSRAFHIFVILTLAMIAKQDDLGVTSLIRAVGAPPSFYLCALAFLSAESWELATFWLKWVSIVSESNLMMVENGRIFLIADATKQSKESRKSPGVKKLFQESEDSSKPQYINGLFFGCVSVLLRGGGKMFSCPLSCTIHDGVQPVLEWVESAVEGMTHPERIVWEACAAAEEMGKEAWLLMDRYFFCMPAILMLNTAPGGNKVHIITRCKKNCTGYYMPAPHTGPGRPASKGARVSLMELFSDMTKFKTKDLNYYGTKRKVSFFSIVLLKGRCTKELTPILFVLSKVGITKSIFATTDINANPEDIIEYYCLRFKIETMFRTIKQHFMGLFSHFWSKAMPKLRRFASAAEAVANLESIPAASRQNVINCWKRVERLAMIMCVSIGIVQMAALKFHKALNEAGLRWLRTANGEVPSEASTQFFLAEKIRRRETTEGLMISEVLRQVKNGANKGVA
ncbi:MAG: hypothetical protein LBT59_29670 [Clostridiales bacterium]|nr:hypothetical protein [Clostridiales bacterium]